MTLFIRADADTRMGTGHVMRCLALAHAWPGEVVFLGRVESEGLRRRIAEMGARFIALDASGDVQAVLDVLSGVDAKHVALDGYHFTPAYQRAIRAAGYRLLVIDDNAHLPHYHTDILLNQNIYAPNLDYTTEPDTVCLLGTRYALLRPEFARWQNWTRDISNAAHKVLVTMGGGDPDNVTLKVVEALQKLDILNLDVKVVVGAANPHRDALVQAAPDAAFLVNVADMSELMAWADVAVSAAGSTSWELIFMGLPSLLVTVADNQRDIAAGLDAAGAALGLGWHADLTAGIIAGALGDLLNDAARRHTMSAAARDIVDGQGAARVVMHLRGERLRLRRAREADCRMIWEWANDPVVRAVSFASASISWENHVAWFEARLADPDTVFYIALNAEDAPVGQVRFAIEDGVATISVSVAAAYRSEGYGAEAIRLASQQLFYETDIGLIHAYIKHDNPASARAFAKAGYTDAGGAQIQEHEAYHMTLKRDDDA
jgi:UDP-2,4-diacetamido-2,4,6-trideoxy-beta-L-altropyranose hydrolase